MPTLIFTYSPKEGVPFEDFERFLREIDQPATLSLPSAVSSRILRVQGDDALFQAIEILEITSFEEWDRDTKRPEVKVVLDQWPEYADMESVKVYKCEEFYAGTA